MVVWFDRRVWGFVKREKAQMLLDLLVFQTLADALKYIFKEIIIPASANKVVFILAPIVTMTLALSAWAVIFLVKSYLFLILMLEYSIFLLFHH